MDKNGNVKISVTGYILLYYPRLLVTSRDHSRAELLETAWIRCLIISSNTEDIVKRENTEKNVEKACVRLGRIEKRKKTAEKRGTPRAPPFRELISHESVRKPGEHSPLATRYFWITTRRDAVAQMYHADASPRSFYLPSEERGIASCLVLRKLSGAAPGLELPTVRFWEVLYGVRLTSF